MERWVSFIKKLIALDVIWGSRTKKLAGVNDKNKLITTDIVIDAGTKTITFINDNKPLWLDDGKYFRIFGGLNDEQLFRVSSSSGNYIEVVEPILSDSGVFTLDGRIWVVHDDNTISRRSPTGGTMFNVDNFATTGVPDDCSGVAKTYAIHYHDPDPWRLHVIPDGPKNNQNLIFTLPNGEVFVDGTLEVYLSCLHLNGNQDDPDRNFDYLPDRTGFIIILNPEDRWGLNRPPLQDEPLLINYLLDLP